MNSSLLADLPTFPVRVKCGWHSKTVTTQPPKYIPHLEWDIECELASEIPILAVLLLKDENTLQYQKFDRSAAGTEIHLRLSFFPYDWHNSDDVQVSFHQQVISQGGGTRMTVNSELLKRDPRQIVAVKIPTSGFIDTGKIIDLAEIHLPNPVWAQILVIPLSQTEDTHGRWRLKNIASSKAPNPLSFLAKGRFTGIIAINKKG